MVFGGLAGHGYIATDRFNKPMWGIAAHMAYNKTSYVTRQGIMDLGCTVVNETIGMTRPCPPWVDCGQMDNGVPQNHWSR